MIIGVCGRVGAGKETLTSFLREKGFVYFVTSDLLNDELKKQGKEITRTNQQDLADDIRKKNGAGAVMKLMLDKAGLDKSKNYIFDSLRNSGEAEFLRNNLGENFILIGVDAPKEIRFKRILSRNKSSDPKTWESFLKMDERDNFDASNPFGQQTGKLLEMSDFVVVNDGDLDKAMKEVEEIWKKMGNGIENYRGIIIEESLENKEVLNKIKILETKIEKVTSEHKSPWITQWTLHTFEVYEENAKQIAEEISRNLDRRHNWYADFKNSKKHFIIFRDKVFLVYRDNSEEYKKVKEYGLSLGIADYQLDFSPDMK
jgi:dephospho-CoA kinase